MRIIPVLCNHGTAQGLVLTVSAVSCGDLQWLQIFELSKMQKDCSEIQSIVKPEGWRNCIGVVSAHSTVDQ
jgi:hypothetical protein